MKKQMNVFALALMAALSTVLVSCNHSNDVAPDQNAATRTQSSKAEYQRLMNARQAYGGTSFDLTEVKRQNDVLTIRVKGGCSADAYKVVWDGRIMESFPMQANLVVTYDGDGSCPTPGNYTLTVDLKKLLGDSNDPSNFNVQVSNGSKIKDIVVDPNGVVTDK